MAICILAMLFIGVRMVSTIKPIYLTLVSIHKPLGYRNFCARSSPLGSTPALCCAAAAAYLPGPMKLAAVGSHYALYALMIAMPLLGWGMLSAAAYPVVLFRGWHLPAILPQSDSLHTLLWDAHFYLAFAFFALILLHIAAVGDNPCTSSALCAIGERCARIRLFRRVHLVERCRDSSECRECTAATRPGPRIGLRVRKRSPLPEMHTGSCSHCRPLSSSFYPTKRLKRAIELDPNSSFARGNLGVVLSFSGEPDSSIAALEEAIRLSPRDYLMVIWHTASAWSHLHAERFTEAMNCANQAIEFNSNFPDSYCTLAAAAAHLGRTKEAQAGLAGFVRLLPGLTLGDPRLMRPFRRPTDRERFLSGLRKAGLLD